MNKFERALTGAWDAGEKNPYSILDPNRYRLNRIGKLTAHIMNEHLDMEELRTRVFLAPQQLQHEYDAHLKIAAKMLGGDSSSYAKLYSEAEADLATV